MMRNCVSLKHEQTLTSAGYTLKHQLHGSVHTFIYHAEKRTSKGLKLILFISFFSLQNFTLILQITFSHKGILRIQCKPKHTILTQFLQLKKRYQRLCVLTLSRFTKQKLYKISILFIKVISVMQLVLAPSNFFVVSF